MEMFVELSGGDVLDYDTQTVLLHKTQPKYKKFDVSPVKMPLAIKRDFLKFSENTYNCLKK